MPLKESTKSAAAAAAAGGGAAEDLNKYQKMTDQEHILKKPDTYIGTIEPAETTEYVMDAMATSVASDASAAGASATTTLTRRSVTYIPGLYKLFDEGMVNMRDHVVR